MDQTPSLRRAFLGLALFIVVIVAGYLWLKSLSDEAIDDASPRPKRSGAVVRFVRSGGFSGTTDTLVLRGDGTGRLTGDSFRRSGLPVALDSAEVATIRASLDRAWPDVPGQVNEPGTCADCFQYDITYRGIQVTLYDFPPREWRNPIRRLNRILDRNARIG